MKLREVKISDRDALRNISTFMQSARVVAITGAGISRACGLLVRVSSCLGTYELIREH